MRTNVQNYSPLWSKTNSLKCHYCRSELASLAGICHVGVGGYIHRLVLMAPLRSRKGA